MKRETSLQKDRKKEKRRISSNSVSFNLSLSRYAISKDSRYNLPLNVQKTRLKTLLTLIFGQKNGFKLLETLFFVLLEWYQFQ